MRTRQFAFLSYQAQAFREANTHAIVYSLGDNVADLRAFEDVLLETEKRLDTLVSNWRFQDKARARFAAWAEVPAVIRGAL